MEVLLTQILNDSLNPSAKTWSIALLVIFLTALTANIFRTFLGRLYAIRGWNALKSLNPLFSRLIYVVGFKVASEFTPLQGRVEVWVDGTIYVFGVYVLMRILEKAALMGIEWSIRQTSNSETLNQGFVPMVRNLITVFVFLTAGIMILNYFHYDAMSLITALGVGSLAVGLAAKDTLSNMISGFTLIIDQNLTPGDEIELGGSRGKVKEIGLRSTQIILGDGNTLIVPNADLINTKIINLSMPTQQKLCSVQIRASFSASYSQIKNHCLAVIDRLPAVSKEGAKSINLVNLAEGYQSISISFWVNRLSDSGSAISDFHEQLISDLRKNGIELVSPEILLSKPSGNH